MTYSLFKFRRAAAGRWIGAAACLSIIASAVLLPPLSSSAEAQAPSMFGVAETDKITVRATVTSVDLQERTVSLVGAQGETLKLKVSEGVQNLPQVKPGDVVVLTSEAVVVALEPAK